MPFPTDLAEFEQDERISYSKLDGKYIAVQDDGTEFEFDETLKRWIPVADEDDEALIEQYQKNYGAAQDSGDCQEPAHGGRKRKNDDSNNREVSSRKNKKQATRQPPQPRQNTAIYVTGLPLDVTVEEVAELFTRKCGVIAEEIDSGRPRIKLYTDDSGNFKGDALIVFFKPQSVEMAIVLLDDTDFGYTASGLGRGRIRVMAADSSYKKTKYEKEASEGTNGEGSSACKDKLKDEEKRKNQDKAKIIKKTQKLSAKLADWDDDEPAYPEAKGGKWDRVVILRHMFTLEELEEDPAALLDIKEDVREECEKLGTVVSVVLYDLEEEGIVRVTFKDIEAAEACVRLMHGRAFGGRTVEAFFATGKEKFNKSRRQDNDNDEDSD